MSPRGSTEPRIGTQPLRELTRETSLGFAFADFVRDVLHSELMPWQEWLAVHMLEVVGDLGASWSFRFKTIVVIVARQQGKTHFEKLLGLFFNYVLGARLVVGTAQNLDNSSETFEGAVELIETTPELSAHFVKALRGAGRREYQLDDGSRWKVLAASRKARGWSADLVMFDELREQRDWEAWGAVSKTTMARPNAVILCLSNAGDPSSVVLRHLRVQGHRACGDPDGIAAALGSELGGGMDADGETLGFFEWSAPPDASVDDTQAWAQANPSLGYGFMTERALRSAMATDPERVFRTECMCQWVESRVAPPFPEGTWDACEDQSSTIAEGSPITFGIDMSADRSHTAIAACGRRADGLWHVEVIAYRAGFQWVPDFLALQTPCKVALQARGAPISSQLDTLNGVRGLEVVECQGRDVGAWCGRLYDAVTASDPASQVRHLPQPVLDIAAECAQTRALGDGAWAWDRKGSPKDISPLVAVTMAYGLSDIGQTTRGHASVYEGGRDLLVI